MAVEGRKQAVSIRLNAADLRNLRKLSRRLGVRNSDVIRYAIKSVLARLVPLTDSDMKGRELVPVLLDSCAELMRYLDLDASSLQTIVNEGAPPELQVDYADVQLLAMDSLQQSVVRLRLVRVGGATNGASDGSVRRYMYDKYVNEQNPEPVHSGGQL